MTRIGSLHKISNTELSINDLPGLDAGLSEIHRFALTFDGYAYCGSIEKCGELAKRRRNDTLSEARASLFFEQRRSRHGGAYSDEGEQKREL